MKLLWGMCARQRPEVSELQSFRTLLSELATRCRNICEFGESRVTIRYTRLTEPIPLRAEAFRLLQEACSQQL